MTGYTLIGQIHEGMHVKTSDGVELGKITQVWVGTDPVVSSERCDEDVCSRLEVHHGTTTTYIPVNALATVAGKVVTLTVDAATVSEKGWYRKPRWIQDEPPPPAWPFDRP
jgi:hypothetical protein